MKKKETQHMGVKSEVVAVSPEQAKALLATCDGNRPVSLHTVAKYARDMSAGRWELNGETIILDSDGALINGEHRLRAIVESGCTILMNVVRGVRRESRQSIDSGRSRSVGDRLSMEGQLSANQMAARARIVIAIESGVRGVSTHSYHEIRDAIERHRVGLDWAAAFFAHAAMFGKAPYAGALAYCYPVDPQRVERFAIEFRDGIDLKETSPSRALREYMFRDHEGRGKGGVELRAVATLWALMAYLRNEQMRLLRAGPLMNGAYDRARAFFAASLAGTAK